MKYLKYKQMIASISMVLYICYYCASRSCLSNLKNFIINDYNLTASEFGIVSSIFFVTYSLLQPFGGFILDTVKLRKILPILLLLSAISFFILTKSESFAALLFSRFTLAISFSVVINSFYKYFAFLPTATFGKVASFSKLIAYGIGAIFASNIILGYMSKFSWRAVMTFFVYFGLFLSFIIFASLTSMVKPKTDASKDKIAPVKIKLVSKLKKIFCANYIYISIYSSLATSLFSLINMGWGNDLIILKFPDIAVHLQTLPSTMNMLGCAFGYLCNGLFQRLRFVYRMFIFSFLQFSSLCILVYFSTNYIIFGLGCFIIGMTFSSQILGVMWVQRNIDKQNLGLSLGILNFCIVFLGTAAIQWISGVLLDYSKSTNLAKGLYYPGYIYDDYLMMFKYMFIAVFITILMNILFYWSNRRAKLMASMVNTLDAKLDENLETEL